MKAFLTIKSAVRCPYGGGSVPLTAPSVALTGGSKTPKLGKEGCRVKKTHFPSLQKRVFRVKKLPFPSRGLKRNADSLTRNPIFGVGGNRGFSTPNLFPILAVLTPLQGGRIRKSRDRSVSDSNRPRRGIMQAKGM